MMTSLVIASTAFLQSFRVVYILVGIAIGLDSEVGSVCFGLLLIFWNYERKPCAFQRDAAHTKNGGYQPVTLLQAALMIFQ